MPSFDGDMHIGQAFTSDEAIPIIDLRYSGQPMENEPVNKFEQGSNHGPSGYFRVHRVPNRRVPSYDHESKVFKLQYT